MSNVQPNAELTPSAVSKLRIDPDYADILSVLFGIRNLYTQQANELTQQYPKLDPQKDARITVFWNCSKAIESTGFGLVFTKRDLKSDAFWDNGLAIQLSDNQKRQETLKYIETGLESFLKLGLLQFVFSVVEGAFRSYLRTLAPAACNGGRAEFQSIYKCLLQSHLSSTPPNSIELLELWREVRNVIHNNGVYFNPRTASDKTVQYKSESYHFRHGHKIDFVKWKFLLRMVNDLACPHL